MSWPCWVLEATNFVIACGFLLGLILMNVPQHYQCWKHRSAEGLSLGYILICTISNVTLTLASLMGDYHVIIDVATNTTTAAAAAFANDMNNSDLWNVTAESGSRLLLEGSFSSDSSAISGHDFEHVLFRIFATLNACMPTVQNFMSILVGVPSLVFYYFLFSKPQPHRPTLHRRPASQQPLLSQRTDSTLSSSEDEYEQDDDAMSSTVVSRRYYYSDGTEFRLAVILTVFVWLLCLVCFIFSGAILVVDSTAWESTLLQVWGSTAAITNMLLYFPQIVTTWRNQHEGVLSMASFWVSVAGDIGLAIFWIVASSETIWVYASCVADAGMQLILIAMIWDFRRKRARERANAMGEYGFVYNVVSDEQEGDRNDELMYVRNKISKQQSEIEVVYAEVLEIYSSATTAFDSLWESSTIQTTTHGSVDHSSREFLI